MGVVHTPSVQQHAEIRQVIASANPDVVVIEIDQMRLDTLMLSADDNNAMSSYGGELATAASAAAAAGSVIILGDARAKDSISALLQPGWPIDPGRAFRGLRMAIDAATHPPMPGVAFVDVIAALRDDVAKLGPILGAIASSVALLSASTALGASGMQQQSPASTSVLVATFAIMMRVFDVLLLSRDDVLAASTLRALRISQGLQSGDLIRRRWSFQTDPAALAAERASMPMPDGAIPFFILKRPIAQGESRRLNLFEPRWLALMDEIAAESPDNSLVGAAFGCLLASNRLYIPDAGGSSSQFCDASSSGDSDDDAMDEGSDAKDDASAAADDGGVIRGRSRRLADVVVAPCARRVRVTKVEEGLRPVTGARKIAVWIEGEEMVDVEPSSIQPTGGGFLAGFELQRHGSVSEEIGRATATMSRREGDEGNEGISQLQPDDDDDAALQARVVCVVGLAHANGVIDRCAQQLLCD